MSHSRFALVQKLHSSDEDDPKTSKEDENLVPILVLWGVVGGEEHHCKELARFSRSRMEIGRTWNPKNPGIGHDIGHSNEELPQVRISGVQLGSPGLYARVSGDDQQHKVRTNDDRLTMSTGVVAEPA